MVLHRTHFGRSIVDILSVLSHHFHIRIDVGQTFHHLTGSSIHQIQIKITIPVIGPINKCLRTGIFQKNDRCQRFGITFILFLQQSLHKRSGFRIILIQTHMLLRTVKYLDINIRRRRMPGYIRQILFPSEICNIHKHRTSGSNIVNSQAYLLRLHAGHRIFYLPQRTHTRIDIQQRKSAYLTLVLPVKSQFLSIR